MKLAKSMAPMQARMGQHYVRWNASSQGPAQSHLRELASAHGVGMERLEVYAHPHSQGIECGVMVTGMAALQQVQALASRLQALPGVDGPVCRLSIETLN